ncbi:MAG: hypothetical protein VX777_07145 [Chlamydiota bacterium]|nr:hypothetical protein [Chlamydiota bacterium]
MTYRRRSFFTLIELLISMALMSLVLSALTYFYYQINQLNRESEKIEAKAFRLRYLENRLMSVLPRTIAPNDKQKDFYFFSGTSSDTFNKVGNPYLVFTFDNSVNLVDPQYSNHVIGRIFLDNENNLSLAVSPTSKRWQEDRLIPLKREILLDNVSDLRFSFFTVNNMNFPSGSWVAEWKQSNEQLPALLKIEITEGIGHDKEKKVFVFPLPNSNENIIYSQ